MQNHRHAPTVSASLLALAIGLASAPAHAEPLPVGGSVVAGSAAVSAAGNVLTVSQSSQRAVINWQSFDVGSAGKVVFNQPNADSATLNRVTGAAPSTIAGAISANGSVFLVNPNGITITKSGVVTVARGFVASTLDIADADFLSGKGRFAGTTGEVANAGSIVTGAGGYVGLLGAHVASTGSIVAPAGQVSIGAVTMATLDLNGDNFLTLPVPGGAVFSTDGKIVAMPADAAREAARGIVNLPSSLDARLVGGTSGDVYLSGSVNVDSTHGNAGHITIIGDNLIANGSLSARALGAQGNGGLVETSGHTVDFTGLHVDTRGPGDTAGTWLIDPVDLTLDSTQTATVSNALATSNVTLTTTATTALGTGTRTTGDGNITINGALSWSSARRLTLSAYNDITINSGVTAANGTLVLLSGNNGDNAGSINLNAAISMSSGALQLSAGTVANPGLINPAASVNVDSFTLSVGAWSQVGASLPAFSANDFQLDANNASFLRATGGDGTPATPYLISDLFGLQGIGSDALLGSSFALANDISAQSTRLWNGGAGFTPIGVDSTGNLTLSGSGFYGTFDGQGHTISGLAVNSPGTGMVGLFGYLAGSVSNLTLNSANVTGAGNVGALAGINAGSITNSSASGTVNGSGEAVGGLVGYNPGQVIGSSSTASVTGSVGGAIGGLVGLSEGGTITGSHATGTVTGPDRVGGLVGANISGGTIDTSYATGTVNGSGPNVGGLAGLSDGSTIIGSYATGNVSGASRTGGLVGFNNASDISTSYATGSVNGTTLVGGLVGYDLSGSISDAYATGNASGTQAVGGLIGGDELGTVTFTYATGAVVGTSDAGGLMGTATNSVVTASYWDTQTSLQSSSAGGLGLTTAALRNPDTFTADGWSIDNVGGTASTWRIYDGFSYPLLRRFLTPATVTAGSGTFTYNRQARSVSGYTLSNGANAALVLGTASITNGVQTNAGTYATSVSGLYSSQQGYDLNFVAGTLTINPAALTVTANALSRTYGAANPALTYTQTGLVNGDTLTGALTTSATSASNVGTYAISQGTLAASSNYTLSYTGANLTINPAALTVTYTATPSTSTYGVTPSGLGGTAAASGLVNGDTLAGVTSGTAVFTTTAGATSNVGSYAITGSGLAANSSNYTFSFAQAAGNASALRINPAALTVTANALSRTYGAANPALTYTQTGLVNGDTLTGALATSATAASNVGTYAISQGTLAASSNYTLSYTGADLTINPAALTVTANALSRTYGAANPALTYTQTGLVNGDTLTGALATSATAASNVGTYAISQGTLAASNNYTLSYTGADLTINPAALTYVANPVSRLPSSPNPALTGVVIGFVAGDTLATATTGTLSFTTTATPTSPPGAYPIIGSGLAAVNYVFRQAPGNATALTVTPVAGALGSNTIASTTAATASANNTQTAERTINNNNDVDPMCLDSGAISGESTSSSGGC